jgi:RHS repeat-associated protein
MRRNFVRGFYLALCLSLAFTPLLAVAANSSSRPANDPKPRKQLFLPPVSKPARRAQAQLPPPAPGQTRTLLPNGLLLLIGGRGENGPTNKAILQDPFAGQTRDLPARLNVAREWHSATMLPDGAILILGGVGVNGRIVRSAELYNSETQTFNPLRPSSAPDARAYHTATLLPDGNLLIAGGVADNLPAAAQLWNSKTGVRTLLSTGPNAERQKHRAILLADGTVLLQGGSDSLENPQNSSEIFNPAIATFTWAGAASEPVDTRSPFLTMSRPSDGETGVAVDTSIALVFSKSLRADTANAQTFSLSGPSGPVGARVVPTENGRLVFVTPLENLDQGVTYSVVLAGAVDAENQLLTSTSVTFTTTGDAEGDPNERTPGPDISDSENWNPDERNRSGNWRSDYPETHWQKLPPLQAAPGVTALAGQVLTLDGRPLANITLKVGSSTVHTDHTGRFLLQPLTAGHHVLKIDGQSASTRAKTYGIFRVGVDIAGGKTDVLNYTIWIPKLDTEHAVTITSPTLSDVTATTPKIPGLELQLPAGTAIRGIDGETVTKVSITPIPVDRPPFPLPSGINVPVFFTIQPGGAQIIPPRGRVIYPNYTNEAPGSRIDFWNYDPTDKGWYIYGRGTVTADGKQVVPDPGVVIYEFSGLMINTGQSPPAEGPVPCDPCVDGDPVNLGTGLFVQQKVDLYIPDVLPIALARTYRPRDTASRAFGIGATHPYDMFLWSAEQYKQADLILPDGGRVHFDRVSNGSSYADAVFWCLQPGPFYKAEIRWNTFPDPDHIEMWRMTLVDGTVFVFGENAPLQRIRDSYGNTININRASVNSFGSPIGNVTKVTSPSGKYIEFTYDTANRITKVKDNTGREVNYTYDTGRLWKVTDAKNGVTEYSYDTSHRMLSIKDPKGIVYLTNEYDANGRVSKQILADDTAETTADNPTYLFAYTTDSSGRVIQSDVTDPRGNVRRVTFNNKGYWLTNTYALGTPEQQTYTVERQFSTNLILNTIDPLGRKTAFTYDADGRLTSVTALALTAEAVTTTYTYDVDYSLDQPTTITDPLGRTASAAYHEKGNILSLTDAIGRRTTFSYNENGLPILIKDSLAGTTRFDYQTKVLLGVTDPLGRTMRKHVDAAGRTLSVANHLGHSVRYEYDAFNQPTKMIDSLEGVIEFSYDPNGNLLTMKDARNKTTTYTYNNMDRVKTRTDQLQGSSSSESFEYDVKGSLTKYTDRRGKATTFGYDNLDRMTFVGYGATGSMYESTTNYTYDAGDRLRTVVDSQSGTITLDYDSSDRLLSTTTPQGTVTYTYDKIGRRKTMKVAGQPTVNYTYDSADRLTAVSQGSVSVGFTYDQADRLLTKTFPNGIVAEYDYDLASQVTAVTYKLGESVVGDLTYEYDESGRPTKVGGSFARSSLPQPLASATYDDANRLTEHATTNLTYDANGNLTNDGPNTYTWDARNRLVSISGNINASFQYDAFGRRLSKLVNGTASTFLYDGADVVQEQTGAAPSVNLLLGGLDNLLVRQDAGGVTSVLTGMVGSTLALVDSSGAVQTEYTYEPFGKTTASGAASGNTSQFTGRESDDTNLYYYRARYYSPIMQRFIGEDPIGLAGGDANLYAYVGNSPTSFTDPFGFQRQRGPGPLDLGLGYTAAVDPFNGLEGFEIHVFNPKGEEIGICSGRNGWIAKHGHPAAVPPGTPRDVLNKLNGLNMTQLRARNLIPAKGTAAARESKSGGYLSQGRTLFTVLNVLSLGLSIFNEYQAETELEMRARKNGLTPEQQFFRDSERMGHPEFYMTPMGPMPNPYRHGRPSPFIYETRKNHFERDDAPKDKNNSISARDSLGTGR